MGDAAEDEIARGQWGADEDEALTATIREGQGAPAFIGPCDLHEVSCCVICHPRPAPSPKPMDVSVRPRFRTEGNPPIIPAGFDSDCPSCDGPIYEGDLITKSFGEWVHQECAL